MYVRRSDKKTPELLIRTLAVQRTDFVLVIAGNRTRNTLEKNQTKNQSKRYS